MRQARQGSAADYGAAPSHLRKRLVAAAFAAATALAPAAAPAAPAAPAKDLRETPGHAHVYLMRGLMNIFSLGMDQLAATIASHGVEASVHNHAEADAIVSQIAARYRGGDHGPIILIGHSLGADAVMMMAQSLNRMGVPVALVVPFDGTGSYVASKNVACVLNLTQRYYAYMRAGAGFHGKLSNVNVSGQVDHLTIDKSPQLQGMALKQVLQAAHGEACRPGGASPAVAKPKEQPAPAPAAAKPNEPQAPAPAIAKPKEQQAPAPASTLHVGLQD